MKELYPRGTKVKIPKTKEGNPMYSSSSCCLCMVVEEAGKIGQDYLYYDGVYEGNHVLRIDKSFDKEPNGNFYNASEIIPYSNSPSKKGIKTINKNSLIDLINLSRTNASLDSESILKLFTENLEL